MSNLADEVHRAIREYRTYLATGARVRRRDTAALRFSGTALAKLKKLRQQLADAVWAALRELALKPADLFELLFLARRHDYELGLRSDKDVEGGVECVRAEALDELDRALDRLVLDNVELAGTVANTASIATDVERELMRRAAKLLDDLLCSCSPPSQHELWQYWLDVRGIEQLIACLHDLHLGPWAVKLGQEARRAAQATDEFHESTLRKVGGWETPHHEFLISQENGCRIGLAHVFCEIRQKLRRIGEGRRQDSELTDDDRAGIERISADVSTDLKLHVGGDAIGTNANAKRRGARLQERKRPVWERLDLRRSSDGSDHTAILDKDRIPVRGEAAIKMLEILQEKEGDRVKGTLLHTKIGRPPNQVYALLRRPLQLIIDKPGQGGTGYAMRESPRRVPPAMRKSKSSRKKTVNAKIIRKAGKRARQR